MITTFFLLLSVLSISTGVAISVTGEVQQAQKLAASRKSFTAAEALVEDIIYRLQNGYTVTASESLTVGGTTATATVTNLAGKEYTIKTTGNENDALRSVETNVIIGAGNSFGFGVQVGNGGFIMEQGAGVEGNVYSNGSILGSNGAYITGSAIVAGAGGLIDNIDVGTTATDEAWANTVTNSTIIGNLYCQLGTDNNKSCDTSRINAESQDFPVTQEDIDAWKTEANAGTVIIGDYVVSGSETLGPAKITGNLTFDNNSTLILAGPLWIVGNITTGNNSIVKLGAGYGTNSEILLTDGLVNLSNNTDVQGSGDPASYVLLLTTSSSLSAVNVNNNAGTVIINAQNGRINFANNSGAKQATADTIYLNNNAVVTYESGLISVHFTSGPSGSFIVSSWQEVE